MHLTTDLHELTGAALLDHAEEVARTQRECEVQVLRIAVQHAIINNPDRLDPALTGLPGGSGPGGSAATGTPRSRSSAPPSWGRGWASRRGRRSSLIGRRPRPRASGCPSCGGGSRRWRSGRPTPGTSPAGPGTSRSSRRRTSTRASPSPPTAGSRGPGSRSSSRRRDRRQPTPRPRRPGRSERPGDSSPTPPAPPRTACAASTSARPSTSSPASTPTVALPRRRMLADLGDTDPAGPTPGQGRPDAGQPRTGPCELLRRTPPGATGPTIPTDARPDDPSRSERTGDARGRLGRPDADGGAIRPPLRRRRGDRHRPRRGPGTGHRGLAPPAPRPARQVHRQPGARPRPARRRWTPTRSPTDIDRPCI